MIAEVIAAILLLILVSTIMLSHINQPKLPPYRIIESIDKAIDTGEITATRYKVERYWLQEIYMTDATFSTLNQARAYVEAMTEESK